VKLSSPFCVILKDFDFDSKSDGNQYWELMKTKWIRASSLCLYLPFKEDFIVTAVYIPGWKGHIEVLRQ
jgi:hypothetical protein